LRAAAARTVGATVFAYRVSDPERYGIVSFDSDGQPVTIEEKPQVPKSNWAVTGLYFYDNRIVDIARTIKPSPRGELEITDINAVYLQANERNVERLGRGAAWLDMGTKDSLLEAGDFVRTIEKRQGLKIGCLEEIAFHQGWLSRDQLLVQAERLKSSEYGHYLKQLVVQATSE
jgi:glucose-1-phosphate thymidylyltransferase